MLFLQRAIELIYPNQCAYCTALVDETGGLCASCWRKTRFTTGHVCDLCAVPLAGEGDGTVDICDECMQRSRPWSHGRAALVYEGVGRKVVLSLKYGDRTDLVIPAATWMAHAGADLLQPDVALVPVPAHWRRLLKRRYNPAVELAKAIGDLSGQDVLHDALVRNRHTKTQEGLGVEDRFKNVENAIAPHPTGGAAIRGRRVCVVDDTMTSGATLAATCEAVHRAGAEDVSILVLAKTVKASYL